jgi:hypothetical protein
MRRMIGFLSAAALATTAAAQSAPDPLDACAQKADAAARLACFDKEMQRRHAPHTTPTRTPPAAARQADDTVGLEGTQLRKKLHEKGIEADKPKPQPMVAQVQRALSRPDHRYTLVLDNGQVWEQVDSQAGLFIQAHEPVTITPGLLGSFFLETAKQKYVRVRRLQ